MPLDLYTGIPVSDYTGAAALYERLLGHRQPPSWLTANPCRNLQPRLRSLPAAAAGRLTQGPFSAVDGAAEPPRRRPYAGRLMTRLEGVGAETVCEDLPYFRIL